MSLRSLVFLAAACAACTPASRKEAAAPAARAFVVEPVDGAEVTLPLTLRLDADGIEVAPADGQRTPGRGHLHLFIDADVTPGDQVIPKTTQIVHLGSGAKEYTIESLEPGPHRIIVVMADGAHIPIPSVAADTIRVTVAATAAPTP